tara:strand:- start:6158 stop:6331 length:174 start_codon:yes stop_codon:yes gene_type:complete
MMPVSDHFVGMIPVSDIPNHMSFVHLCNVGIFYISDVLSMNGHVNISIFLTKFAICI